MLLSVLILPVIFISINLFLQGALKSCNKKKGKHETILVALWGSLRNLLASCFKMKSNGLVMSCIIEFSLPILLGSLFTKETEELTY